MTLQQLFHNHTLTNVCSASRLPKLSATAVSMWYLLHMVVWFVVSVCSEVHVAAALCEQAL